MDLVMTTTPENNEKLLAKAITAGDLEQVRELVEAHGCAVRGPGPWNQVPLALAAENGHVDIIDYLVRTRRGAEADESTLRAAIEAGRLDVVTHLLDNHGLAWTAREYELAFATYDSDMLKYAFESAMDEGWFEETYFSENRDKRLRIVEAARDSIARFNGGLLFNKIMEMMRVRGGQARLFFTDEDPYNYWFLFDTMESRPDAFPAVWELVHDYLFDGSRYGALDGYVAKPLVDEMFRKAITSRTNAAFYVLLQYALPQFKPAIALAVESGNDEIAEYLTRCCQ
jgi:hypothetical protein